VVFGVVIVEVQPGAPPLGLTQGLLWVAGSALGGTPSVGAGFYRWKYGGMVVVDVTAVSPHGSWLQSFVASLGRVLASLEMVPGLLGALLSWHP
jgi:hypothetical protein